MAFSLSTLRNAFNQRDLRTLTIAARTGNHREKFNALCFLELCSREPLSAEQLAQNPLWLTFLSSTLRQAAVLGDIVTTRITANQLLLLCRNAPTAVSNQFTEDDTGLYELFITVLHSEDEKTRATTILSLQCLVAFDRQHMTRLRARLPEAWPLAPEIQTLMHTLATSNDYNVLAEMLRCTSDPLQIAAWVTDKIWHHEKLTRRSMILLSSLMSIPRTKHFILLRTSDGFHAERKVLFLTSLLDFIPAAGPYSQEFENLVLAAITPLEENEAGNIIDLCQEIFGPEPEEGQYFPMGMGPCKMLLTMDRLTQEDTQFAVLNTLVKRDHRSTWHNAKREEVCAGLSILAKLETADAAELFPAAELLNLNHFLDGLAQMLIQYLRPGLASIDMMHTILNLIETNPHATMQIMQALITGLQLINQCIETPEAHLAARSLDALMRHAHYHPHIAECLLHQPGSESHAVGLTLLNHTTKRDGFGSTLEVAPLSFIALLHIWQYDDTNARLAFCLLRQFCSLGALEYAPALHHHPAIIALNREQRTQLGIEPDHTTHPDL